MDIMETNGIIICDATCMQVKLILLMLFIA